MTYNFIQELKILLAACMLILNLKAKLLNIYCSGVSLKQTATGYGGASMLFANHCACSLGLNLFEGCVDHLECTRLIELFISKPCTVFQHLGFQCFEEV